MIAVRGNVLVLTEDADLISAQLAGASPGAEALVREPLLDNVSTDEIIPGWCCYWYDAKLADYAYLGLRNGRVTEKALRGYAPQIVVSGEAKGCGSSREHAVYAEKYAGVELVFAHSFERIYQVNCRNVGIITCQDFDLLDALLAGERLPWQALTRRNTPIEKAIIANGGLLGFSRAHSTDRSPGADASFARTRPLNIVEKIIQSRLADRNRCPEGASVRVGESYFLDADIRFSHEYVTAMAAAMFSHAFGAGAGVADPGSCYFFQDHLTLAPTVLSGRADGTLLIDKVTDLNRRQAEFAKAIGGQFIGPADSGGGEAICHNYMIEHVVRPGEVVIGTDSHTCTSGAVGAFAFGVGATDIANAWYSRQILVTVPPVIRLNLTGRLRTGVCAKDLMLALLAHPIVAARQTLGTALLFGGPGAATLNMDERATLCNMAVEAGALTGIVPADDVTAEHLAARGQPGGAVDAIRCDRDSSYASVVGVDLSQVEPMVALPGDPRNAVPLASIPATVGIDTAYGGSCTGGKASDMDMYASVFRLARDRGARVAAGVEAYLQVGSDAVWRYAKAHGYLDLFDEVGVDVLPPSCGACINAGPGVSRRAGQVTVSAQNRNYPGRSGPGQVYLASPYVVAASAIAGRLTSVTDMFDPPAGP